MHETRGRWGSLKTLGLRWDEDVWDADQEGYDVFQLNLKLTTEYIFERVHAHRGEEAALPNASGATHTFPHTLSTHAAERGSC